MGLFSGIKKAFKGLWKGVKKVFKKVGKAFSKVMNNKWVKGALMAVSLFTGVGAIINGAMAGGGGFGAFLQSTGKFILDTAKTMIRTPIDIVAKGIGAAGKIPGLGSLSDFAKGINSTLDNALGKGTSIFGDGAEASTTAGKEMQKEAGIAETGQEALGLDAGAGMGPGGPGPVTAEVTGTTADAAGMGPGGLPSKAPGPSTIPDTAASPTLAGAGVGPGGAAPTAPTGPTPAGPLGGAAEAAKEGKKGGGFFSAIFDRVDKASTWLDEHQTAGKMITDAIAGATAPNEAEQMAEAKQKARDLRAQEFMNWQAPSSQGAGGAFTQALTRANAQTRARGELAQRKMGGIPQTTTQPRGTYASNPEAQPDYYLNPVGGT